MIEEYYGCGGEEFVVEGDGENRDINSVTTRSSSDLVNDCCLHEHRTDRIV